MLCCHNPHVCTQAVEADAIDILAVQAPDCKQLPDTLIDLLQTARTSLLVYNHRADDSLAAAASGVLRPELVAEPSAATAGSPAAALVHAQ